MNKLFHLESSNFLIKYNLILMISKILMMMTTTMMMIAITLI